MRRLGKKIVNNGGFSLVELMVASVIGMALVAGATITFIAQNRSYNVTESVSEVNSQSKTALNIMVREIRLIGMGLDRTASRLALAAITPVDGGGGASDSISFVAGLRQIGTLSVSRTSGPVDPANAFRIYVQDAVRGIRQCPGGVGSKCWLSIDGVFLAQVTSCANTDNICTNPNSNSGLVLNRRIPLAMANVLSAVSTVTEDAPCDTNNNGQIDPSDICRPVFGLVNVTYFVNNNMQLIRNDGINDEIIAENIEDLQFAYAIDANDDGSMDDTNVDGLINAADFINNGVITNNDDIIAVRISILARTDKEDYKLRSLEIPPNQIENRNHLSAGDGFRRRLWQSVVNLRNMENL